MPRGTRPTEVTAEVTEERGGRLERLLFLPFDVEAFEVTLQAVELVLDLGRVLPFFAFQVVIDLECAAEFSVVNLSSRYSTDFNAPTCRPRSS